MEKERTIKLKIKLIGVLAAIILLTEPVGYYGQLQAAENDNEDLAFRITALFRAYRKCSASNKNSIHKTQEFFKSPEKVSAMFHKQAQIHYKLMTKTCYPKDEDTQFGKVSKSLEAAVDQVFKKVAEGTYDLKWTGENEYIKKWDGKLLPARFASLIAEQFNKDTKGINIKLTTSDKLLINKKNAPDAWELKIIGENMLNTSQKTGKPVYEQVGKQFRYLLPEYYAPACIQCHGTGSGQEGFEIHPSKFPAKVGSFAGAISVIIETE